MQAAKTADATRRFTAPGCSPSWSSCVLVISPCCRLTTLAMCVSISPFMPDFMVAREGRGHAGKGRDPVKEAAGGRSPESAAMGPARRWNGGVGCGLPTGRQTREVGGRLVERR